MSRRKKELVGELVAGILILAVVALILWPLVARAAKAQMPKDKPVAEARPLQMTFTAVCTRYEEMTAYLQGQYQEGLKEGGQARDGVRVEMWKSRAGATWTWLIVLQNGFACAIASGTGWLKR